jgi:hypothetical protein
MEEYSLIFREACMIRSLPIAVLNGPKKRFLTPIRAAQHNQIQESQTFRSVQQVRVNHGLELIHPPLLPCLVLTRRSPTK